MRVIVCGGSESEDANDSCVAVLSEYGDGELLIKWWRLGDSSAR